jgi:NDP-sugar pyrophosphorylase family protein
MKQFFNLVVPMAGKGSRFKEQGYKDSKPFIDVNGKPMIQRVIENLNFEFNPEFKTIILCQKSDYEQYDFSIFREIIGHDNIEIIQIDGITEGAACTLLLAEKFIDNSTPMLSFNTDQMIDYDVVKTFHKLKAFDAGMPCFKGDSPAWSYAKTDFMGLVTEVAEKKVISNNATAGYYYWGKGSEFVKYAKEMINANDRVNNEFYVAPVYNYAIKDGKKVCITNVDNIYQLGTPEDLEIYLNGE